eukprot:g74948.t1
MLLVLVCRPVFGDLQACRPLDFLFNKVCVIADFQKGNLFSVRKNNYFRSELERGVFQCEHGHRRNFQCEPKASFRSDDANPGIPFREPRIESIVAAQQLERKADLAQSSQSRAKRRKTLAQREAEVPSMLGHGRSEGASNAVLNLGNRVQAATEVSERLLEREREGEFTTAVSADAEKKYNLKGCNTQSLLILGEYLKWSSDQDRLAPNTLWNICSSLKYCICHKFGADLGVRTYIDNIVDVLKGYNRDHIPDSAPTFEIACIEGFWSSGRLNDTDFNMTTALTGIGYYCYARKGDCLNWLDEDITVHVVDDVQPGADRATMLGNDVFIVVNHGNLDNSKQSGPVRFARNWNLAAKKFIQPMDRCAARVIALAMNLHNWKSYIFHSFRSSAATQSSLTLISSQLQRAGRWKNPAILAERYVELSDASRAQVATPLSSLPNQPRQLTYGSVEVSAPSSSSAPKLTENIEIEIDDDALARSAATSLSVNNDVHFESSSPARMCKCTKYMSKESLSVFFRTVRFRSDPRIQRPAPGYPVTRGNPKILEKFSLYLAISSLYFPYHKTGHLQRGSGENVQDSY